MFGQIIGSLDGLAKLYINTIITLEIIEVQIIKKLLMGEIDYEHWAIYASKSSWKRAVDVCIGANSCCEFCSRSLRHYGTRTCQSGDGSL